MADSYCRNCGQQLRSDERICLSCGKLVQESANLPMPEVAASGMAASQENGASTQDGQRSLMGLRRFLLDVVVPVFGAGAGLLAVFSFVLYTVGLLALWLPIRGAYTHDLSDAWYAASLAPKTMVIGLGIGQLLAPPTYIVVGLTIMLAITGFVVVYLLESRLSHRRKSLVFGLLAGLVGWLITLFIGLPFGGFFSLRDALSLGGFSVVVGVIWGLLSTSKWRPLRRIFGRRVVATEVATKEKEAESTSDEKHTGRRLWLGVIGWMGLMFLEFFVLGIIFASTSPPQLPQAELAIKNDGTKYGTFLAHTDGFWYIFDEEGEHKGELIAVPDSEVRSVQVFTERKN